MIPAAALPAIAAFNLICTGTLRTGPVGLAMPEASGEPFTITYRVDLASRTWCSGDCAETEPLADVTDTEITLREAYRPTGSHVIIVGRLVGIFADTAIDGTTATLRSGRCAQAAFTGFPIPTA
ncbi:MAG TPA: hypothetical protein VGW40_06485 [Allosphingosinicella sp.]|nr:hypothetical protein [Allosphingosinicella sp.]